MSRCLPACQLRHNVDPRGTPNRTSSNWLSCSALGQFYGSRASRVSSLLPHPHTRPFLYPQALSPVMLAPSMTSHLHHDSHVTTCCSGVAYPSPSPSMPKRRDRGKNILQGTELCRPRASACSAATEEKIIDTGKLKLDPGLPHFIAG
jgi:hypothetical protein